MAVREQIDASWRYIRQHYGRPALTEAEAQQFYEEDEDPQRIFARYDAGPWSFTERPAS